MGDDQNSLGNDAGTNTQEGSGDPKLGRIKVILISLSMVFFAIFVYAVTSKVTMASWLWGAVLIMGMVGGYHIARKVTMFFCGLYALSSFLLVVTIGGWAVLIAIYLLGIAVWLARSADIHAFFDSEHAKRAEDRGYDSLTNQ